MFCPFCGAKATSFSIQKVSVRRKNGVWRRDYIYLLHPLDDPKTGKKIWHRWYYSPFSNEAINELLKNGIRGRKLSRRVVLGKREIEALRKYYLWRKGYSEEERELARRILSDITNATIVEMNIW